MNRKELIILDNLAELNFLSGPNKNVEKSRQYRFRLVGVPPDQAIRLITVNIEQGVEDIKKTIKQEYKLNPIFAIQLIFKGKLLPENINLRKIGIHHEKDIITIMNLMGGGGNQEMKCVQCGTSNVNEILVSFVAEDEQSNLYEDITTLPKFLYYLEHPTDKRGKIISQPVQKNVMYGGIVYIIKPIKPLVLFKKTFTEIYIGVTWKTLIQRFIEHTEDAIEAYVINSDWPNRLIECLILRALEIYITETYSYSSEISPLSYFIENKIIGKEKWQKKSEIEKIAVILYNAYFQMEVIEVHRNYETAWFRETWNIKNYPLCINGEKYQGTLYPNGLNMVISPTTPGYQTLPLYDIIFLVSLGYIGPELNEMIREYYSIEINYRTIYRRLNKFWEKWDNLLEMFFKPVIQVLLTHENFKWRDIARSIHRAPSYRNKRNFRKWFFGLNITQLRNVMKRQDFNWNNLEEIAIQLKTDLADQSTVKRIPIDVWIEWFIKDIGMEEIAKILGYKNVESFRSAWIKQGRVSIFQKKFGSNYSLAVKKYRKKRTIELLTDEEFLDSLLESKLYWIYVNEFRFMRWENLAVNRPSQGLRNCKQFFNTLFKEEGLAANDFEKLTAFNYMEDQKIYDAVTRISNS